jgi:hypothetical protein
MMQQRTSLYDGGDVSEVKLLQFDDVFARLVSSRDFDRGMRSTRDNLATICIQQTPEWALPRMLFHLIVRTATYGSHDKSDLWLGTAIEHWNPTKLGHLLRKEMMTSSDSDYIEGLDYILKMSSWSRWAEVSLIGCSYRAMFKGLVMKLVTKLVTSILFRYRQVLGAGKTTTSIHV